MEISRFQRALYKFSSFPVSLGDDGDSSVASPEVSEGVSSVAFQKLNDGVNSVASQKMNDGVSSVASQEVNDGCSIRRNGDFVFLAFIRERGQSGLNFCKRELHIEFIKSHLELFDVFLNSRTLA